MNNKTIKIDKLPTIRRLPTYLHILRQLSRLGDEFVKSGYLAEMIGGESILVRKDLELTGITGIPNVGYCISELTRAIEDYLGWGDTMDAFLVGAGRLGTALLGYEDLTNYGLKIVAAFDNDPIKINSSVHGVRVFDAQKIPNLMKRLNVRLAVLTLPPEVAQDIVNVLVESGIKGIWNFTPATLDVPDGVAIHKENLLSGYAVLSVKMTRSAANE